VNECLFGGAFEDGAVLVELAAVEGTIIGIACLSEGLAGVGTHEHHSVVCAISVLEYCEVVIVVIDAYYLGAALLEI